MWGLISNGEHQNSLNRTSNCLKSLNGNKKSVQKADNNVLDFVKNLLLCLGY